MAQKEYLSEAGPYVEAMRTVRGAKNLFFALLAIVLLFLAGSFCAVRYGAVLQRESGQVWDNFLSWAFPFFTLLGVVVGFLYVLTLLVGLKVSLAGRLEGVAGLTKGFFWSMFLLVILLPWQHILVHEIAGHEIPLLRTVPGVLFGLDELKQRVAPAKEKAAVKPLKEKTKPSDKKEVATDADKSSPATQKIQVMEELFLAIRFLVYPLAALLLLVVAQSKYKPQRVELPEPVKITRVTSPPAESKETSE